MSAINTTSRPMQKIVRDRVRGVANGDSCGLFLHGRPGTSKTHIVRSTLDELGASYVYINGHLTDIGLFETLAANTDKVIVLDDLASILRNDTGRQILLAALGNSTVGLRLREIRHVTAKGVRSVAFTGGLICIANSQLDERQAIFSALRDRVSVICYDPTDDQITEDIFVIAGSGPREVAPQDACIVAAFLVQECRRLSIRPTLRMFVDRAISDFKTWESGDREIGWRELISSDLQQYSPPAPSVETAKLAKTTHVLSTPSTKWSWNPLRFISWSMRLVISAVRSVCGIRN